MYVGTHFANRQPRKDAPADLPRPLDGRRPGRRHVRARGRGVHRAVHGQQSLRLTHARESTAEELGAARHGCPRLRRARAQHHRHARATSRGSPARSRAASRRLGAVARRAGPARARRRAAPSTPRSPRRRAPRRAGRARAGRARRVGRPQGRPVAVSAELARDRRALSRSRRCCSSRAASRRS